MAINRYFNDSNYYAFFLVLDGLLFEPPAFTSVIFSTSAGAHPKSQYRLLDNVFYTGNNQAISVNKALGENPFQYADLPLGMGNLSTDVILSRQLHGTRYTIFLEHEYWDGAQYQMQQQFISRGIVGEISLNFLNVSLELVSDNELLKTDDKAIVSFSCMNTLGDSRCQLNLNQQRLLVISRSGRVFNTASYSSGAVSDQFEVLIGSTHYLVDKTASSATGSIKVFGNPIGVPQILILQRHCNRTFNQCKSYGNLARFSGNTFLKEDAASTDV
jgi:hypothetical protein